MSDPITPYAGTSGWSGSETSRRRAERADTSGLTGRRQREVVRVVASRGVHGATCAEVQAALQIGHGSASGALSVLHYAGRLDRLTLERNNQQVYVLPEDVRGRERAPRVSNPDWRARYEESEAENERLRERIAALEQRVADLEIDGEGRLW